jgi:hypothetical protein
MMPAWLIQENFNTICAAAIVIIDVSTLSEKSSAIRAVIELLLLTLSLPQSPVTQLRAVGALLLILEKDVKMFLDNVDSNIEHWIRVMLSLMNCQTLCVRSIAVDFVVSLLSGIFKCQGNVDSTTLMFGSILPEVVAREIGIYCASGHVATLEDVARSVWPIRRAIADVGDANPLDDDRVDSTLAAILTTFSRACQAIIDGILIELRLRGDNLCIVGLKVKVEPHSKTTFDADEESLFEAASFFRSEFSPIQKIRWLLTLKSLHVSRKRWLEATECLLLCVSTICIAIPHLKDSWWPSKYALWSDDWMFPIGLGELNHIICRNLDIMALAQEFLEPNGICRAHQVGVKLFCDLLVSFTNHAIEFVKQQSGFEAIYHNRLVSLAKLLQGAIAEFQNQPLTPNVSARMKKADDESALHTASNFLNMKIQELGMAGSGQISPALSFVAMRILGNKPKRFEESTTIPTFLEWEKWCVCRIPFQRDDLENISVASFTELFVKSLCDDDENVILRTNVDDMVAELYHNVTYIDVVPVKIHKMDYSQSSVRHFIYHSRDDKETKFGDLVVMNEFPCAISRQRALEGTASDSPVS